MTQPARPPLRLAVLISGSGSTLRNILERVADGRLQRLEVVGVLASRDCAGLEHARQFGVPHVVCERRADGAAADQAACFDPVEFSARVTAQLEQWGAELVACAGFLSLYLPPQRYRGRVLNVHPALLPLHGGPGMYGDRVHAAVLASGAKVSGCTVHLVNDDYDAGPIVAQRVVPVLDGDTPESLGARVREAERELYPTVLQWFADERVSVDAAGNVEVSGRELLSE